LRLDATIAFPPKDTILISLPASTAWCRDGRSLLLESLSPEGSGVLLQLRYRDSLTTDSFPIVMPGDTSVATGAVVALRFFLHDTPRGYTLDSGRVRVQRAGGSISVSGAGTGVESAIRIRAQLEARDVPIGRDTVSCNTSP
jgi:hypothetical protein